MELASGSFLAEKFQIIDRLSRDEEPPLYLAADRTNQAELGSLQVLVAIRVLNPQKFNRTLFEDHLRILKRIKSENILSVYDVIHEKKRLLVSVERYQGCCLVEEMRKRVFSSYQIMQLLHQIVTGIEVLHNQGIIHGAISEWSIQINEKGVPKIDPLTKNNISGISKSVDFKGLGILGLQLAKAKHYSPNSIFLKIIKKYLTIETYRESSLNAFIEEILNPQNNQIEISYIKNRLSKLLLETQSKVNTDEYSVVLSESFVVKSIITILLATLGLFLLIASSLLT